MYNYHVDIIWKVDIALLTLSLALGFTIIASSLLNTYSKNRRKKALLNIKKDMVELILSGKAAGKNVCPSLISGATPRQFIDIQSNRDRESVFFNDAEQKFFKECFVNKKRLSGLEKIASRPGNKWRRIEAIMCLGYSEDPSILKTFPKLLRSRDPDILYFSILALGQIKTAESAKMLLSILKRDTPYRRKIVSLLENFPHTISNQVIDLAEDKEPAVRLWALKLWSRLKDNRHLGRIEKLTRDDSAEVRAVACECLGTLGNKNTASTLQKCLGDNEWIVRSSAIVALSEILGDECLPIVINRINDGSLTVVDTIRKIITKHAEAAIPYILEIFEAKDEFAKKICLEALENSDSQLAATIVKKLKGEMPQK